MIVPWRLLSFLVLFFAGAFLQFPRFFPCSSHVYLFFHVIQSVQSRTHRPTVHVHRSMNRLATPPRLRTCKCSPQCKAPRMPIGARTPKLMLAALQVRLHGTPSHVRGTTSRRRRRRRRRRLTTWGLRPVRPWNAAAVAFTATRSRLTTCRTSLDYRPLARWERTRSCSPRSLRSFHRRPRTFPPPYVPPRSTARPADVAGPFLHVTSLSPPRTWPGSGSAC
jgi:hypothetical protein